VPQNDDSLNEGSGEAPADEMPGVPAGWQRVVRCPITGRRVVAARPGQRPITSEEVYALLEEEDELP